MCASPKADFRYTTFSKLVISYNLSFSLALKFKNKQMSQNKFSVFVLTAERNSKRIVDLSLWCLNRVNLPYYLAVALWYKNVYVPGKLAEESERCISPCTYH